MEFITQVIDVILHLNKYLDVIVRDYGTWVYLILFLIIFCETGLVVTPFLPGDSLLFAIGALAAMPDSALDVRLCIVLLLIAAILGDSVNYWIGHWVGPKVFQKKESRFLNPRHLERTHEFYEKYGGKAIIFARFIPIVRTFAPFVAGVGRMTYSRFMFYNVTGGVAWIVGFILAGYFFGNIPVVKKNFSLVILVIIILSVMPAVIEILREWLKRRRAKQGSQ